MLGGWQGPKRAKPSITINSAVKNTRAWHMCKPVISAPQGGGAMAVGCRRLMADRGSGGELQCGY